MTPAEQPAGQPADQPTAKSGADTAARPSRRPQLVAAILMAATAAAFWGASRLTWATVSAEDGLSPQRAFDVTGADWSPWLTPLALVYLAGIVAVLAVRGWALRVVAILVAVGGVLAAFPAVSLLTSGGDSDYAAEAGDIPDRYVVLFVDARTPPALLVLLGTACAVAAAVMLLRVARGAASTSKYTTPAARREKLEKEIFAEHERRKRAEAAEKTGSGSGDDAAKGSTDDQGSTGANERMMWDALDTGIDPTDPTDPDAR